MYSSLLMFCGGMLLFGICSLPLHAEEKETPELCGGQSELATGDREVAAAAAFAVKAEAEALGSKEKPAPLSLVKIVSARHQVVAGMNYFMALKVKHGDVEKDAEAVVWKQLSQEYKLTTWTWKNESAVSANMPKISAHLSGENYGKVEKDITIGAQEEKIFHHHSDFDGGGLVAGTNISFEGKYVKIRDYGAVSSKDENGREKMSSTERIFLIPAAMITREEVELQLGWKIILTQEAKNKLETK